MTNMKRTLFTKIAILACASLFIFSTVYAQENADSYEVEEKSENVKDSKANKDLPYQNKNLKTKVSNILLGDSPVELGEGSLFEYSITGTKLQQSNVTYYYYPKASAIVLQVASTLSKYYIFLNKPNCISMKKAFNQYLKDFDAHTLSKKYKETYAAYGHITAEYRQGMIGTGTKTKPKTSLGYRFVKKSPYFCFTMWPAEAEAFIPGTDVEAGEGSSKMTFFMTKKQGAKMLEFIDESIFEEMENMAQQNLQEKEVFADEY